MAINYEKAFIKGAVGGIIWGLAYLYIRRYMNPKTTDKYKDYTSDAMYGALAATAAFVAKAIVNDYLNL